jgi:hypothetical protein
MKTKVLCYTPVRNPRSFALEGACGCLGSEGAQRAVRNLGLEFACHQCLPADPVPHVSVFGDRCARQQGHLAPTPLSAGAWSGRGLWLLAPAIFLVFSSQEFAQHSAAPMKTKVLCYTPVRSPRSFALEGRMRMPWSEGAAFVFVSSGVGRAFPSAPGPT